MSYPTSKYIRQPGGFSHGKCTPAGGATPSDVPCDCYVCRNDGRPDHVVIQFGGFAENAQHNNGNCACLNASNTTFNGSQSSAGSNAVFLNGVFQGWQLSYVETRCGSPPLDGVDCNDAVWCVYQGPLNPTLAGIASAGVYAIVWLGWTATFGISVVAQIVDSNARIGGSGASPNNIYYEWVAANLPGTPGNVICHSDGSAATAPNSIGTLLTAVTGSAWHWTGEFYSAGGILGQNYLCGPAAGGQSQPGATCGLTFIGSTKIAPPCCCGDNGDGAGEWNRPLYACIGSDDPSCPIAGLMFALMPAGANHWNGSGAIAGGPNVNGQLSYDPSSGQWTFTFDCGGQQTTVHLTATGANPNLTLTGSTSAGNTCCPSSGPLQITIGSSPVSCLGPGAYNAAGNCGCAPGVAPPLELAITVPSPGLPPPFPFNPGCDVPPLSVCPAIGGAYVVQYQGYFQPQGGGGYCFYQANFPLPQFTYSPGGNPANGTGTYSPSLTVSVKVFDAGAINVLAAAPFNADCPGYSAAWNYTGPAQPDCTNFSVVASLFVPPIGTPGGDCPYGAGADATVSTI